LILTGVLALALAGGIAAAVVVLTDDGGNESATTTGTTARAALVPKGIRNGGYLSDATIASTDQGAGGAQPSSSGGLRGGDRGEEDLFGLQTEKYAQRAYPADSVTFATAQRAKTAFTKLPLTLSRAAAPNATSRLKLANEWQQFGPTVAKALPYGFTGLANRRTIVSGRVSAIAVGPKCVAGGCVVYTGSAGGGVFRTNDALAKVPVWKAASDGLTSISIGSLAIDPRDPSGNTVYAGTGDSASGADSEAGAGLFKTTNGGQSWALVPGSQAVAKDRSISAVLLDPRDPKTFYIATLWSLHGTSAVSGGHAEPPNAAPLGLYKTTDGGATFSAIFKAPRPGNQHLTGVKDAALDPNDPDTIYLSAFRVGIYRLSKKSDGDSNFHLIYKPTDFSGKGYTIPRVAVADLGKTTRLYVSDSDVFANPGRDGEPAGSTNVYRLDNAWAHATPKLAAHGAGSGWKLLTSKSIQSPGYAAYRYCQTQCDYSNVIASPAGHPNEIWLGGTFDYGDPKWHQREWSNGRTVIRSTDGGLTWNDMSADTESPPYIMHPDQHAMAFSPINSGVAFLGSDGGIVRTSGTFADRTEACATRGLTPPENRICKQLLRAVPVRNFSLNSGLPTLEFQSVSVSPPGMPLELLGGTQDNGTWSFSNRTGWISAAGGDGGQSVVGRSGSTPVHIHTYYKALMEVNYHGFRSDSWRLIYPPLVASGERTSFYVPLVSDPKTPGVVFTGLQHVWRTSQFGGPAKVLDDNCDGLFRLEPTCGQWVALGAPLTSTTFGADRTGDDRFNYVDAVARAPSDTSTVWASTTPGRVFVSQNADGEAKAVTWNRIDIPSGPNRQGTPGRFSSGIVVDPANPLHAWISYSGYDAYTPNDQQGHVFEVSVDPATGKATWTNRSYDLGDQPITALARDNQTGDLYAGTDFGVVRLPAGATSWTEAAKSLPYVAVYGLTIAPDNSSLYAATHGRGVWSLQLH